MILYVRCKVRYRKDGDQWRCSVTYPQCDTEFFGYGKTKAKAFAVVLEVLRVHKIRTAVDLEKGIRTPARLRRKKVSRGAK